MDLKDPNMWSISWQWVQTTVYSLLAAFGGAIGYMMRSLEAGMRITLWRTLVEGGAAGFVGTLVALLCSALHLTLEWTGVIVGVCGWMGANATIRFLERIVWKRFGLDRSASDANDQS